MAKITGTVSFYSEFCYTRVLNGMIDYLPNDYEFWDDVSELERVLTELEYSRTAGGNKSIKDAYINISIVRNKFMRLCGQLKKSGELENGTLRELLDYATANEVHKGICINANCNSALDVAENSVEKCPVCGTESIVSPILFKKELERIIVLTKKVKTSIRNTLKGIEKERKLKNEHS